MKHSAENWLKEHWRPAMALVYMIICIMDFVGFPLLAMFLPTLTHAGVYVPWSTLTLANGGLIHMSFGTILGISAWTRGNEKITEMNIAASADARTVIDPTKQPNNQNN